MEPIFTSKYFIYNKVELYPDHLVYTHGVFKKQRMIMLKQIASMDTGMKEVPNLKIITSSGETIKIMISAKDKATLVELMSAPQSNNSNKN